MEVLQSAVPNILCDIWKMGNIYGPRDPRWGVREVETPVKQKSKKSIFCSLSECLQAWMHAQYPQCWQILNKTVQHEQRSLDGVVTGLGRGPRPQPGFQPVSYTHLTLPTILLV